jgi:predicted nucleotidyltransferase
MITTVEDVKKTIENIISTSEYSNRILRVGVFGSVARGTANEKSDVDLLLDFKHDMNSMFDYFSLCDNIERVFKKQHGKKVSLVETEVLTYKRNKNFGEDIERDVIWIYGGY